ncbi:hypothetical protein FQN50_004357 [Emmonsiellopsis sp. PD_5]|nr:hypothetical protein FQN50_004357 [Emmonsiellopsis sp. PD_5]
MGIPMDDNIHAPTVPSGPTSAPAINGRDVSSLSLNELFEEKTRLEAELKVLSDVLDSHGVTMSTSLTTFDGYPRDDLDIAQIRTTRARIIHLRNDYKNVMAKVEQVVHARFATIQEQQQQQQQDASSCLPTTTTTAPADTIEETTPQSGIIETPFAKVNSVVEGSPAAQAGLKVGDRIRSFGHVNWMNHENLSKVAEVVQRNEGYPVLVKLVREDVNLSLTLVPQRNWGGRGLLGCHLVLV